MTKNNEDNGNKPLEKFAYIILSIFVIGSTLLCGIGYFLYINGINPFKN